MKSHINDGKMKFTTLLVLIIVFYGGFAAFKIISANIMKGQIKGYIIEQFGYVRGHTFTPEKGEEIIRKILVENGVLNEDMYDSDSDQEVEDDGAINEENSGSSESPSHSIYVEINPKNNIITFEVSYYLETNLLFFKYGKEYIINETMQNY